MYNCDLIWRGGLLGMELKNSFEMFTSMKSDFFEIKKFRDSFFSIEAAIVERYNSIYCCVFEAAEFVFDNRIGQE